MVSYDLSILIPARNEMFLARTVDDILENIEGNTEIIVVLDGALADPPIIQDPRVTVIYHRESIGQRAATNEACKLSSAKYVMKVDAHCAFDKGFDVKMMAEMKDDYTMVPVMRNLHAFDWVCPDGHRRYQGPSGDCKECGKPTERDVVWIPKTNPQSTSYRFDRTLHFQYFNEYAKRVSGDLTDTMSLQGSCFMLTREKYWELDICDEKHGSWGQQGVEVACKTWLSGGRVVVNHKTWYAHMFRTQGGDFGFPYELKGSDVEKARQYSRDLFLNDKWDKAIHPLSWLIEKFSPVPDWTETKGIIYYTDNRLNVRLAKAVQKNLSKMGLPIVSASLKPMDFGKNIVVPGERGPLQMFKQILAALEASESDIIFFAEHDVLYHPSHFDFTPKKRDVFYYNTNVWKVRASDGHSLKVDDCKQLSGLCAYRDLLIEHYKERIRRVEQEGFSRRMGYEPGTHNRPERVDDYKAESWQSEYPNIDIRHSGNMTASRWTKNEFRNQKFTQGWTEQKVDKIKGWDNLNDLSKKVS